MANILLIGELVLLIMEGATRLIELSQKDDISDADAATLISRASAIKDSLSKLKQTD